MGTAIAIIIAIAPHEDPMAIVVMIESMKKIIGKRNNGNVPTTRCARYCPVPSSLVINELKVHARQSIIIDEYMSPHPCIKRNGISGNVIFFRANANSRLDNKLMQPPDNRAVKISPC